MRPTHGFSLVETAVVLLIFGAIASMAIVGGSAWLETQKQTSTRDKIEVIHNALQNYYRVYGRLPCPSDYTLATNNANWALEANSPTAGDECRGGTIVANRTNMDTNVVFGGFPVRTLGIEDQMAFDGWESAFVYYVDKRLTVAGTLLKGSANYIAPDEPAGAISILIAANNMTNPITTTAAYAVVSMGANRHGGRTSSGATVNNNLSTNDELENCECSAGGALQGASTWDDQLVSRLKTTDGFDDIVSFKLRRQMW